MSKLEKFRSSNVLFVDDDDMVRYSIDFTLKNIFNKTFIAPNGRIALELCRTKQIDLIITDIEMPDVDGIEFIKQIREIDLFLPIVILSAHTNIEYLFSCVNLNIQAYIVKPITSTKLRDTLHQVSNYLQEKIVTTELELANKIRYDKASSTLIDPKGERMGLKKKEKLLLDLLLKNKNSIVSYETIEEAVWNDYWEVMTSYALRTVVKNLRKKVGKEMIENISGQGYRLGN